MAISLPKRLTRWATRRRSLAVASVVAGAGAFIVSVTVTPVAQAYVPATCRGWVQGSIAVKWESMGGVRSHLGCPISDRELIGPDGSRYTRFVGGAIFWHPAHGAHEMHGAIAAHYFSNPDKYRAILGFPITDEHRTPPQRRTGVVGAYNHFSKGGSIYYSPGTGAHEIHGAIRQYWAAQGWEQGPYAFPSSDEKRYYHPELRTMIAYNEFPGCKRISYNFASGMTAATGGGSC